jgi:hypothetical protein
MGQSGLRLKAADAAALIRNTHSDKTILVGGQAVSFWAVYYGLKSDLPILTNDIDYLGTAADARRASAALPFRHKLRMATLSDATPNTALLSVDLDGYDEPVLIDYLAQVVGLETRQIQRSSVLVEFEGARLQVIHPVLLLQSKIANLYHLGRKRTPEGREQARLAIEIVASFLGDAITASDGVRETLKAVETVGKFSATAPAIEARVQWDLDCLSAIPARIFEARMLPLDFYEKRWPQIRKKVDAGLAHRRARSA